jgi:hypothetical protein
MVKHLSDYDPAGTTLGQDASDKIGFYGTTPAIQPAATAQAAVSTAAITAVVTTGAALTSYGFTTTAQPLAIATAVNLLITRVDANTTLVNKLRADLVTLGLIKGTV